MEISTASLGHVRFAGRRRERQAPLARLPAFAPCAPLAVDEPLSQVEERLAGAILGRAGLSTEPYRERPLKRRLRAAVRAARAHDAWEALAKVEHNDALADHVLNVLLIGYTEPFRDRCVFEALRDGLLRKLAAGRGGLRVWSAGCSSGAELYSVGLLLAEQGLLAGATLRGTDCRPEAIAEAAHGGATFWDSIPAAFQDVKNRVDRDVFLREMRRTEWRQADVLAGGEAEEAAPWDLILCRNLAIYLKPEPCEHLWRRLGGKLAPGGLVVTGKAGRPMPIGGWLQISKSIFLADQ